MPGVGLSAFPWQPEKTAARDRPVNAERPAAGHLAEVGAKNFLGYYCQAGAPGG